MVYYTDKKMFGVYNGVLEIHWYFVDDQHERHGHGKLSTFYELTYQHGFDLQNFSNSLELLLNNLCGADDEFPLEYRTKNEGPPLCR